MATAATSGHASLAGPQRVPIVKMNAQSFLPAVIRVKMGETVKWLNPDIMPHTVSFTPAVAKVPGFVMLPAGVTPFESPTLDQGDEFSHVFCAKGTYGYVCRFHQRMGMAGKVIVT